MLKYQDIFAEPRIRRDRLALCKFLEEKRTFNSDDMEWHKVSPVMEFFQGLALYTRSRGLPIDFVHGDYFYWLSHYWVACKPYIKHCQKSAPLYLSDAEWLYEECLKIDINNNAGAYSKLMKKDIDDFLDFEITTLSIE